MDMNSSLSVSMLIGLTVIRQGEDDEAINYFIDLIPRIKQKYEKQFESEGKSLGLIEFIQEEGRLMTLGSQFFLRLVWLQQVKLYMFHQDGGTRS
jgi:hypothetical protein